MASLWKDCVISLGDTDYADYRLSVEGGSGYIYQGRAYRRPGETECSVRINNICADYIKNTLPTLSDQEFSNLVFPLTFFIEYRPADEAYWDDTEVSFINDWSYDAEYDAESMGMAFPITGRLDSRQWLFYTALNASTISVILTMNDDTQQTIIVPVELSNDFNDDYNDDFSRSLRSAGSGTITFDLSQYPDAKAVQIGTARYTIAGDCHKYALYYVNKYGGWDSLLIEGTDELRDTITRYTHAKEYDNRDQRNRGIVNYANEVRTIVHLNSGLMTSEESQRMDNLLTATEVYLCEIGTGAFVPVVLNNTAAQYKTFKTNGGRMINYEIDVEIAHYKERR